MTYKCFIHLREGEISLYEVKVTGLELLKKEGEESHLYNEAEFWNWWKKKFNYNGEEVAFIIAADQSEFKIPEDINIIANVKWGKKEVEEINNKISPALSVITYPNTSILIDDTNKTIKKKSENKPQPKKGSIADYFQTKTQVIDKI